MSDDYSQGKSTFSDILIPLSMAIIFPVVLWLLLRIPVLWASLYASYYSFGVYEHLPWLMSQSELREIINARAAIPKMRPGDYGIVTLFKLFAQHGYIWRWVVCPLMMWWGWSTYRGVARFRYRSEIRNVYDLIEIQAQHFPASAIIRGKNLLSQHPYIGPWATYAMPLDFALDHGFLWASKTPVDSDSKLDRQKMVLLPPFSPDLKLKPFRVKRRQLPSFQNVLFDIQRADKVFSEQCGGHWTGYEALPPLIKALYAIFVTQAAGERLEAWKMVEQIAFSFREATYDRSGQIITPHSANTDGVDNLLQKYASKRPVIEVIERHAHTINVLVETLALARKKGRLVHANLLWLKPVNRTLWYAVCGQGGQCPYFEANGPWAHAQVERKIGKKIPIPQVLGAIEGMRDQLSREHWIDPEEYSEEFARKQVTEANAKLDKARQEQEKKQGSKAGANNTLAGLFEQAPAKKPAVAATAQTKSSDEP